jgi:hypothetical protein
MHGETAATSPSRDLPEEIELCRRCQSALVFHLPGDAVQRPYCAKCGAREPGVFYVRKDRRAER